MAPTIEVSVQDKKKSGIRRLLSPGIFASDHRKKNTNVAKSAKQSEKTTVETAFVGSPVRCRHTDGKYRRSRSRSLSPVKYKTDPKKGLASNGQLKTSNWNPRAYCTEAVANQTRGKQQNGYVVKAINGIVCSTSEDAKYDELGHSKNSDSYGVDENINVEHLKVEGGSPVDGRSASTPVPYSQYYNKPNKDRMSGIPVANKCSSAEQCSCNHCAIYQNNANISVSNNISSGCQNEPVVQRPRSVSPVSASKKDENRFVRGTHLRSTVGSFIPKESIIYEGTRQNSCKIRPPISRKPLDLGSTPNRTAIPKPSCMPISKRGVLLANNEINRNSPLSASKRVSFSPSQENSAEQTYWPTRKGMSSEPPTRQSTRCFPKCSGDESSLLVYATVRGTELEAKNESNNSSIGDQLDGEKSTHVSTSSNVLPSPKWQVPYSESESGSEAGEIQRILHSKEELQRRFEEDWKANAGGKGQNAGASDQPGGSGAGKPDEDQKRGIRGVSKRDDIRRHTLSGDHHPTNQQQIRPPNVNARSVDLEMPPSRGYSTSAISSNSLFEEDPGIMSEAETSCTGFRRGNKLRSSLPVVRTPSKTLERPLGVVFLQYRNETKRALLPNEITSLHTVKALFVRSFPKQLTLDYLDSPGVKIYMHDCVKNVFYELEDSKMHLREIVGGSILRLYDYTHGPLPSNFTSHPAMWDQDQSYFSEPEFDSEYEHQHIHKSKLNKSSAVRHPYYMTHSFPPGTSTTLPRGGSVIRPFSPAAAVPHGTNSKQLPGFVASPERAAAPTRAVPYSSYRLYEDPYYAQFASRTGTIDEEASESELLEENYNMYSGGGMKLAPNATPVVRSTPYTLPTSVSTPFDTTRLRVEHMERQLANLTGLVQKALTHTPAVSPRERELGSDKSVSFEKSVSFSDEPPGVNSPIQHSPQHTERERMKPSLPPKPLILTPYDSRSSHRDIYLTAETYNQLRSLQKKAKDLRQEIRNLRRMSHVQAHAMRETVKDTFIKIKSMVMSSEEIWSGSSAAEKARVNRDTEIYKQEMSRLEVNLGELETTVEELRANVINRKMKVNMSDVENMALILSKSSKTVADLKLRFPALHSDLKAVISEELDKIVVAETFLKEEPEKLESALKRCKKLTGTLVTLKRLASVQEQRLPDVKISPTTEETPPMTPTSGKIDGQRTGSSQSAVTDKPGTGSGSGGNEEPPATENTLDSLLEELKTFSKTPTSSRSNTGTLRRLNSCPGTSDSKPTISEKCTETIGKRIPPPPPPRTSSKSPLASPTSITAPVRNLSISSPTKKNSNLPKNFKEKDLSTTSSSSCESINSQEGVQVPQSRQEQLEIRHQELLRKQKALQEQYARLQQLQKSSPSESQLKKTGSESNILGKLNLTLSTASTISGSLSQLTPLNTELSSSQTESSNLEAPKVYETDIL